MKNGDKGNEIKWQFERKCIIAKENTRFWRNAVLKEKEYIPLEKSGKCDRKWKIGFSLKNVCNF